MLFLSSTSIYLECDSNKLSASAACNCTAAFQYPIIAFMPNTISLYLSLFHTYTDAHTLYTDAHTLYNHIPLCTNFDYGKTGGVFIGT